MNKFTNVLGCEINLQKLAAFLNTNNELSEAKTRNTIPFTIASKTKNKNKKLGIDLTNEVKETYNEKYKTAEERNRRHVQDEKISHVCGKENIVTWPYYQKQSTDLMRSQSKYQ
jgi:hypothetical protein